MKNFLKIILILASAFLVSCGSTHKRGPVVSTPPAKKVVLKQEAGFGDGFLLKKYTYPTGTYRLQEESESGFYFVAPTSLKVFDTGLRYGAQGGIYWEKGKAAPEKVYVKAPLGATLARKPRAPFVLGK